jgi:hypothetical protein
MQHLPVGKNFATHTQHTAAGKQQEPKKHQLAAVQQPHTGESGEYTLSHAENHYRNEANCQRVAGGAPDAGGVRRASCPDT